MAGPGNIYFAWISDPASEPFSSSTHAREDVNIYRATISQSEGGFRRADLLIDSSGAGLLNTGQPWAHISIEDEAGTVQYMGTYRLTGFPLGRAANDATIEIELIARPADWKSQQDSLIQSLKTAPYYLDEFFPDDIKDSPEEVLAAYSRHVHWDPFTNSVSASDVLEGGRTVTFNSDQIFDGSLSLELTGPPVSRVDMQVEVQFEQTAIGFVDLAGEIVSTKILKTLTPESVRSGWGQMIDPATATGYRIYEDPDYLALKTRGTTDHAFEVDVQDYPSGDPLIDAGFVRDMSFREYTFDAAAYAVAEYRQKRVEIVELSLTSALQEISNADEDTKSERIRLEDVDSRLEGSWSTSITGAAQSPLKSISGAHKPDPSYFGGSNSTLTTRGREAIEHALLRARARLAYAARAVEVTASVPIEDALDLTLDDTVRFVSADIPGGVARGKLIDLTLEIDGDTGDQFATLTIGCCVGTGSASYGTGGANELAATYQNEFGPGTVESRVRASVSLGTPSQPIIASNVTLYPDTYLVQSVTVTNDASAQLTGIQNALDNGNDPEAWLASNPTEYTLEMRDLSPQDEIRHTVSTNADQLGLPAGVNLGSL